VGDAGERRGKGAGEGGGRPAVEDAGEEDLDRTAAARAL
jgi:hypothetical protein